jgi:hypothetical protein
MFIRSNALNAPEIENQSISWREDPRAIASIAAGALKREAGARGVGWSGNSLRLVRRDDEMAEALFLDVRMVQAVDSDDAHRVREAGDEAHLLRLSSHPGLALSTESHGTQRDFMCLHLAPMETAERFIVNEDHLCLANGAVVALGKPAETLSLD